LPFKEALFPAWLTNIKKSQQSRKRDVIRQSKINRSPDTLQKEKIMGKYQLKKGRTCPTLSVIMSTYNMERVGQDRKSTRLNSSHVSISYAVFCLKKKRKHLIDT